MSSLINFEDSKIDFFIAETKEDFEDVYYVRREVFGVEQGYCDEDLKLEKKQNEFYIIFRKGKSVVGAQTFQIGYQKGDISFERYFDLEPYYLKYGSLLFASRNAVLKEYRGLKIASSLYYLIHYICKHCGVNYIITDCKKDNEVSMSIFPKLNFRIIGDCPKGAIGDVLVWGVETDKYVYAYDTLKISKAKELIASINFSCLFDKFKYREVCK